MGLEIRIPAGAAPQETVRTRSVVAATGSKTVPVKSVLKRSNKQERDGYVESASHDGLDP